MSDWQTPGRSTISAYFVVPDADRVVAFARTVFGATLLREPLRKADGRLWSAELAIGDSSLMVGEGDGAERPGFVYVYVEDVDDTFARAIEAGGSEVMPVDDQFYGDRAGGVADPCGNLWWIATHRETLDDDALEAAARAEEARRAE